MQQRARPGLCCGSCRRLSWRGLVKRLRRSPPPITPHPGAVRSQGWKVCSSTAPLWSREASVSVLRDSFHALGSLRQKRNLLGPGFPLVSDTLVISRVTWAFFLNALCPVHSFVESCTIGKTCPNPHEIARITGKNAPTGANEGIEVSHRLPFFSHGSLTPSKVFRALGVLGDFFSTPCTGENRKER